eukprot:evm.model.NODE_33125_length_11953_cov_21.521376.5
MTSRPRAVTLQKGETGMCPLESVGQDVVDMSAPVAVAAAAAAVHPHHLTLTILVDHPAQEIHSAIVIRHGVEQIEDVIYICVVRLQARELIDTLLQVCLTLI